MGKAELYIFATRESKDQFIKTRIENRRKNVETAGTIQRRIEEGGMVDCKICGEKTSMLGTRLCHNCWEVSARLRKFLQSKAGMEMAQAIIDEFVHKGEK